MAGETVGPCDKSSDDCVGNNKDEEWICYEFAEVVSGNGNSEREARQSPGKKENNDAESRNHTKQLTRFEHTSPPFPKPFAFSNSAVVLVL
ncbi:hypothetical protein L195_g054972 [Trifolium pratense]|uniref:Uncharacterized protein n=1 Tax=Trifolium pratense TaxID=57577 RepID=A0A2K3KIW1_TRIPR|nr:hypothetical protein L195_g054972 [Trifolium pratense]